MPRSLSWLPRLAEIRRSVKNSVRSHYERKDIERLFQLQPRAAQALIQGISPTAKVGRSFLLAREALEAFLEQIYEGADPASLLKPSPEPVPRRRLRELVQVDDIPATLDTAPVNISFQSGQLAITFASMEELAGSLLALAQILDNADLFAAFQDRFVPRRPQPLEDQEAQADVQRLFAELEAMKQGK
jgi:hypothetical protein